MKSHARKSKLWIGLIILIVAVGALATVYGKQGFFKGQIFVDNETLQTEEESSLPDLSADIALISPPEQGKDLQVRATVSNLGTGSLDGKTPFKYAIEIDGDEIFSNTDSYTSMSGGDSFSFDYPIPRALYEYKDKGKIAFIVDTKDKIDEENEDNNEKEIEYSY